MSTEIWIWTPHYEVREDIEYKTLITEFESGKEQRRARWSKPRRTFRLRYGVMPQSDIDNMWAFYKARQGAYDTFYFKNLNDNSVTGENVGTGDDSTLIFYLDHGTHEAGSQTIIAESETIYLDGTPQTRDTHYTIDNTTGKITFTSAPGGGVAITADYQFYYIVRFGKDILSRELFAYQLYNVGLRLVEVKG